MPITLRSDWTEYDPVVVVPLRDLIDQARQQNHDFGHSGSLSKDVIAEVLRLWDDGHTTTDIARAVGIAETTAIKYVKANREHTAPRRHAYTRRVREKVLPRLPALIEACEAGEPVDRLARSVGVSPVTMRRALVLAGAEIRAQCGNPPKAIDWRRVEALRSDGRSWNEIARAVGCTNTTLRRRRHEMTTPAQGEGVPA